MSQAQFRTESLVATFLYRVQMSCGIFGIRGLRRLPVRSSLLLMHLFLVSRMVAGPCALFAQPELRATRHSAGIRDRTVSSELVCSVTRRAWLGLRLAVGLWRRLGASLGTALCLVRILLAM